MSERSGVGRQRNNAPQIQGRQGGILQRACACGQHSTAGEECESCRKQREGRIQRAVAPGFSASPPPPSLGAGYDLSRIPLSQPGDPAEREAESVARQVMQTLNGNPAGLRATPRLHLLPPVVQRQVAADAADATPAAPAAPVAESSPEPTPAGAATTEVPPESLPETPAAPSWLTEDATEQLAPGQLHKGEFLAQLRTEVCAASDAVLARVGRSTEGCPYLDYWFAYYAQQSSAHLERAIRRYAPESASARSARDYIPLLVARVRHGVETWATTGAITGVPTEIGIGEMSGAPAPASPAPASAGTRFSSGPLPQGKDGTAAATDRRMRLGTSNVAAVSAQLGTGRALDGSTRSRMESAFGYNFAAVRVHTDTAAQQLAHSLQARAFTLGHDVAFGAGEYQPGTLLGDALLAHELAHVVQQGGAKTAVAPLQIADSGSSALESDADHAAIGVMARLWGGPQGALAGMAQHAMPRLRSGLRLSRCNTSSQTSSGNKNIDGIDLGPTDASKAFCLKGAMKETYGVSVNNTTGAAGLSIIEIEGENSGKQGDKSCSCTCGFLRQYIKGYWKNSKTGAKQYSVSSCGKSLTMNESTWTEEYMACDPQADPCKQRYTDGPGWSSGLSEGDYIELVYNFKFELWDRCQGKAVATAYKTLTLKGDKAPRTVAWS